MNHIKDQINKQNSPTWVRMNEDARKELYKLEFISQHGGRFETYGRHGYVKWEPQIDYSDSPDKYIVENPSKDIEIIEVFSRFCKENGINKAAMYGTLNGTRNHHKGYKLIKTPD